MTRESITSNHPMSNFSNYLITIISRIFVHIVCPRYHKTSSIKSLFCLPKLLPIPLILGLISPTLKETLVVWLCQTINIAQLVYKS